MANPKILEAKQQVVDEITNNVKESSSFIFLENNGLTVSEMMELRRKLKESDSTLNDLSSDQSNTVVFAIPVEVLRALEWLGNKNNK